jgi:glycosyltransferase involved in cell wall biosynthesis
VIIPTKNSGTTIENCLKSVKEQTYPKIEIIVVDNYSKDKTWEIAEKMATKVCLMGSERSAQVNYGVKIAGGKYVYRFDSDFLVEQTVIEECVRKCEEEGFDAIAVHNTSDPTVSFWSKVRKLERDCYRDSELNIAARFIRKDIFEAVGGFDEELVAAEDYDLHNRLLKKGHRIGKIKSQEIHIGEPKNLGEIARKHYYYGKTIIKFMEKNKEKAGKQLSPIRPAFIKHRTEFVRHPILTLGFIIYQLVRYLSAGLGCLAEKVKNE